MAFSVIYWLFVVASLGANWSLADKQSRLLIAGVALAAVASFAAYSLLERSNIWLYVVTIDCALFALSIYFSILSDRFWPLWFAGLQGAAILTRFAAPWASAHDQWLIETLASFWALPCIICMLGGLIQDRSLALGAAEGMGGSRVASP